jgi:hypothetical protein
MDGVAERFYSCFLYGKDARVVAYTKSLLFSEIAEVQSKLTRKKADERVVWMKRIDVSFTHSSARCSEDRWRGLHPSSAFFASHA